MRKHSINLSQLDVGVALPCNVYDAAGRLLLPKGATIGSEEELDGLLRNAAPLNLYMTIGAESTLPHRRLKYSGSRLGRLLLVRDNLAELFAAPESFDFPVRLAEIAHDLRQLISANVDVALASIMLGRGVSYAVRHSVDTAIASSITADAMGLNEATRLSVLTASLVMNIAMLELQDKLQVMDSPLDEEMRRAIDAHCADGVAALERFGVTDPKVLEIVRDHHERIDGSGYPAGKKGSEIALATQLVSLADIYCARVSGRAHRPAMSSKLALRWLFLSEHAALERSHASWFIKALGIYPPGTVVRLINGNVGVVTHRGTSGQHPVVAAIHTEDGFYFDMPIRCPTDDSSQAIYEVLPHDELDLAVDPGKLWGNDAAL